MLLKLHNTKISNYCHAATAGNRESNSTHLHVFPLEVHLDQCVTYKMPEATAVEVAVGAGVVLAIVDLRELQTSILMKIFSVEVLMCTEHLEKRKKSNVVNETQGALAVTILQFISQNELW